MKVILIFGFTCFLTITGFGQQSGTISGLVMINDRPITNATVTLTPSRGTALTTSVDAGGRYVFANLKEGTYTIAAFTNVDRAERKIVVEKGQQLTIDLDLVLDARRIYPGAFDERVTVSASTSQPLDEVSKTVNIISGQEMRDRADFALPETLRTTPGFRVQQLGGFGRTSLIKTRGLRNQDTAVLVDGIRFRDVSAITGDASAFLSDFTLTSVSRVEVLRGSGSSLYGTNAIGGTINFITPDPQPGLHGQISGAWGGLRLQRYRGNISDGTDDGRFGFKFGGCPDSLYRRHRWRRRRAQYKLPSPSKMAADAKYEFIGPIFRLRCVRKAKCEP